MKKSVMILAAQLPKLSQSLSAALKRAWVAIKLKAQMAEKATGFFYRKEDGTERYAIGFNKLMPAPKPDARPKPYNPLVITYFDVTVDAVRSCRVDRLIMDNE
ncbi:SH3 beta-barrel fold-containing protein [Spirosoma sp. SC4-14]|uniref:SH3 beta-barrel fold-containing protein n=1 Tax=Spirosoma sp. SC4-14 TaxID=3128900 RepID=UPI0030D477C7